MKPITAAALTAALALLAACSQNMNPRPYDGGHPQPGHMAGSSTFECENGMTVRVENAGRGSIRLNVEDRSAVLPQAPAASGERYSSNSGLWGSGGEWHQHGSQAQFSYTGLHGNRASILCRQGHW